MPLTLPCASCKTPQTIFWGFSPLTALASADVLALQYNRSSASALGEYAFPNEAENRYIYVAIPTDMGFVESFTTDGYLDLVPVSAAVTVTIGILPVAYTTYRSNYLQHAADINLVVD